MGNYLDTQEYKDFLKAAEELKALLESPQAYKFYHLGGQGQRAMEKLKRAAYYAQKIDGIEEE
jgi:hypothetical protein